MRAATNQNIYIQRYKDGQQAAPPCSQVPHFWQQEVGGKRILLPSLQWNFPYRLGLGHLRQRPISGSGNTKKLVPITATPSTKPALTLRSFPLAVELSCLLLPLVSRRENKDSEHQVRWMPLTAHTPVSFFFWTESTAHNITATKQRRTAPAVT